MKPKKQSPISGRKQGKNLNRKYDTNRHAQCARLLSWLREKPISTIEARKYLDILAPAPRIFELRHDYGFNIITDWCLEITPVGVRHKVAKYSLIPGKFMENNYGY